METIIIIAVALFIVKIGWKVAKLFVKVIAGLVLTAILCTGLYRNFNNDPDVAAWKAENYPGMSDKEVFSAVKDSALMILNGVTDVAIESFNERIDSAYVDIKAAVME